MDGRFDIKSRSDIGGGMLLAEGYSGRRRMLARTLRNARWLAVAITALTIFVSYSMPGGASKVFVAVLPLFILQLFSTVAYRQMLALDRAIGGARASVGAGNEQGAWLSAASIAIYRGYFLLFLCFDCSWLFHAYILPRPAVNFEEYLLRLRFGPIDGMGFIIFTIGFWAIYTTLLIVGIYRADELADNPVVPFRALGIRRPERGSFSVRAPLPDGKELLLRGFRMANPEKQPLILWPGFFQNGFVYDLMPEKGISLGEYLWREGYDCWIVHSRGTGRSGGRWRNSSLDDFAAIDIPAVIDHVLLQTGIKPIYVGHSQGGITAIMSMMGAQRKRDGGMTLSDASAARRQGNLRGLVTLGSFLDFVYSGRSSLKDFARRGLTLPLFGSSVTLITGERILSLLRILSYYPVPVGRMLRRGITMHGTLRALLAPLALLLNFAADLSLWEFLYHIPNVDGAARRALFNRTVDATFYGILEQFYGAVHDGEMRSRDRAVNYSAHYHRLHLPVSFVTMEYDPLADPVTTRENMFERVGSSEKHFTVWKGMGHEDHFMNPNYFPLVLDAIRKIDPTGDI